MATKTAERKKTTEKAEKTEKADKSAAKSEAKTAKADKSLTPDQQWENETRERAEAARDEAVKEQERRVGMTPQEIAIDDGKKQREAAEETRRWEALTQEDKNAELDDPKSPHYEPLPPWQHRVGTKVIDARMQRIDLIYTDGTTPMGGERAEALQFVLDYMTGESEDEDKK